MAEVNAKILAFTEDLRQQQNAVQHAAGDGRALKARVLGNENKSIDQEASIQRATALAEEAIEIVPTVRSIEKDHDELTANVTKLTLDVVRLDHISTTMDPEVLGIRM